MSSEAVKTPALNMMKARHAETQAIHEFLEDMAEKGFHLTKVRDDASDHCYAGTIDTMLPTSGPQLDDHLYEFIGVTADDVEKERRAILAALQQ